MEIFSSLRYFAGTVAVPNTFPELATIEFQAKATLSGGGKLADVVTITERKPQWTIVRTVLVRDVVGVFTTTETKPEEIRRQWLVSTNWKTSEASIRKIARPETGIVYVEEQATVIMTSETALPAHECVECSPPVMYSYSGCCIPSCRPLAPLRCDCRVEC
jgi:hypothetical protein